jgi:hypothetical protein
MTLGEFFEAVSNKPQLTIAYFLAVPFLALLVGVISGKKAAEGPFTFLQSGLIYAVAVPAVFAITLSIYLFFFERRSIMDTNVITQLLPIASMLLTFYIIKKFVPLRFVPGFTKMGDLMSMLALVMAIFWLLEKTRIYVISYLPFQYFILILVAMIVMLRFAWGRLSK